MNTDSPLMKKIIYIPRLRYQHRETVCPSMVVNHLSALTSLSPRLANINRHDKLYRIFLRDNPEYKYSCVFK